MRSRTPYHRFRVWLGVRIYPPNHDRLDGRYQLPRLAGLNPEPRPVAVGVVYIGFNTL